MRGKFLTNRQQCTPPPPPPHRLHHSFIYIGALNQTGLPIMQQNESAVISGRGNAKKKKITGKRIQNSVLMLKVLEFFCFASYSLILINLVLSLQCTIIVL